MTFKTKTTTISHVLEDAQIRTAQVDGHTHYSARDLLEVLTGCDDARAEWDELKQAEPSLRSRAVSVELGGETQDVLSLPGVMRLIQAVDSPKAERLRLWLAQVGAEHVQEAEDPELAIQRLRQGYAAEGRTRRWIDQRLRSISARQEVVGEWYRRGVTDTEQFRALTNRLMEATFGMDVNTFRQSKGFSRNNLRDHLTDLELSLLSLAETTAASLHRHRDSRGMDQLLHDLADAGKIVSETRRQIDRATATGRSDMAA